MSTADQAPPAGYAGRAPRGVGHSAAVGPLGRIRRELGVEPGSAVAVEDSVTGATAAVAAGCRVLYIPSTDGQPDVAGAHTHSTLEGVDVAGLHALTSGSPVGAAVGQ